MPHTTSTDIAYFGCYRLRLVHEDPYEPELRLSRPAKRTGGGGSFEKIPLSNEADINEFLRLMQQFCNAMPSHIDFNIASQRSERILADIARKSFLAFIDQRRSSLTVPQQFYRVYIRHMHNVVHGLFTSPRNRAPAP
jgi:hypothetical protein